MFCNYQEESRAGWEKDGGGGGAGGKQVREQGRERACQGVVRGSREAGKGDQGREGADHKRRKEGGRGQRRGRKRRMKGAGPGSR